MAAVLISSLDEIEKLRFVPFPTRPAAAVKAVRVDREVVALLKNGDIAVSRDLGRWAYPPTSERFWFDPITEALVRLGVISREVRNRYEAERKAAIEAERRRHARKDIERGAETLGITLTKRQLALIGKRAPKRGA